MKIEIYTALEGRLTIGFQTVELTVEQVKHTFGPLVGYNTLDKFLNKPASKLIQECPSFSLGDDKINSTFYKIED